MEPAVRESWAAIRGAIGRAVGRHAMAADVLPALRITRPPPETPAPPLAATSLFVPVGAAGKVRVELG